MGIIYVFVSRNEAVTILAGFHFNIFRGDSPRPEGIIRARQLCWTWFKRSLNEFRKLNNEEVCELQGGGNILNSTNKEEIASPDTVRCQGKCLRKVSSLYYIVF